MLGEGSVGKAFVNKLKDFSSVLRTHEKTDSTELYSDLHTSYGTHAFPSPHIMYIHKIIDT